MKKFSVSGSLKLNRETLRKLSNAELRGIRGGKDVDTVGGSDLCNSDGIGDACGPAQDPPKKP